MFKYLFAEVVRMKKVGRPRKANRKENISVNLPKHLVDQVNDQLGWSSSRSKWIESAITEKLTNQFDWDYVDSKRLLAILLNRNVIDYDRFTLLCQRAAEIEAEQ